MNYLADELAEATLVNEVSLWASLAACIQLSGMKIVPRVYWDDIIRRFKELDSIDLIVDGLVKAGFAIHENHMRSDMHETWHYELGAKNKGFWVIPVEEFLCVAHDDKGYDDLIEITRAVFDGSEEELVEAIMRFCND